MADHEYDVLNATDRKWLDGISTRWTAVQDVEEFVLRYGPAMQSYCASLLPRSEDVDDVLQDLLVRVVGKGFPHVDARKGRFRDYLKATVRNAALTHLRRRSRLPVAIDTLDPHDVPEDVVVADQVWLTQWRGCILDRAWRLLDAHERAHPGSLAHTVLRAVTEHPNGTSDHLAEMVRETCGGSLNAVAFRKQLSRARRLFARLVLQEVAATLDRVDPAAVEQELVDCGLWDVMRDYLPEDWRTSLCDFAPT